MLLSHGLPGWRGRQGIGLLEEDEQDIQNFEWKLETLSQMVTLELRDPVTGEKVSVGNGGEADRWIDPCHPIRVRIRHTKAVNVSARVPVCRWWNAGRRSWSTEGCFADEYTTLETVCNCTHLSSFALGVQDKASDIQETLGELDPNVRFFRASSLMTYGSCSCQKFEGSQSKTCEI